MVYVARFTVASNTQPSFVCPHTIKGSRSAGPLKRMPRSVDVIGYQTCRSVGDVYQFEDKRIEELSAWAEAYGFTFDIAEDDDEILILPLHLLSAFYRSVWNVIRGDWNGLPFESFDLMRGKTGDAFTVSTCAIAVLRMNCPALLITHRSISDSVADLIVPRIGTESSAFDDEWEVRCEDRRFANAVTHQRMMDWLLSQSKTPPRTSFELQGSWLLAMTEMLDGDDYGVLLDDLTTFSDKIPPFLSDLYP